MGSREFALCLIIPGAKIFGVDIREREEIWKYLGIIEERCIATT